MTAPEGFDLWTWPKCYEKVRTLPGRLGFPKGNIIQFLGYEVSLKDGKVTDNIKNLSHDEAPEFLLFLLTFYSRATEVPLTGKLISFRQMHGGRVYDSVFEGRAVGPIARKLGDKPGDFARAAKVLDGVPLDNGDVAFTIPSLPLVPLSYILWVADEEFPARAQILMDGSVENYLDAEAISHLAEVTTRRLLTIALKYRQWLGLRAVVFHLNTRRYFSP